MTRCLSPPGLVLFFGLYPCITVVTKMSHCLLNLYVSIGPGGGVTDCRPFVQRKPVSNVYVLRLRMTTEARRKIRIRNRLTDLLRGPLLILNKKFKKYVYRH